MRRLAHMAASALLALLMPPFLAQAPAAAAQASSPQAEPQKPRAEAVPDLLERMARDDYNGLEASRRLAEIGEPAVRELIRATENGVPRVRYWSIAALSGIGSDSALPAITKCLDDPEPVVRAVAVWHLGQWFDRAEVRDRVIHKLRDQSAFVKGWALELIRTKQCREVRDQVRDLLKDDAPEVRYDALHTLTVLEGPEVIKTLKNAVQEDRSPLVREGAAQCCTAVTPPTAQAAEVLIAALQDEDEKVRETAARLLRRGFGQDFHFRASADPAERKKAVQEWQAWYEETKGRLRWNEEKRRFEMTPPSGQLPAGPSGGTGSSP